MFSKILWLKGFWRLLQGREIEMQISLRVNRKLPKWEGELCKWHCCFKSTEFSSATDLTGVETVPFLNDKRGQEGEVEPRRIKILQQILKMKTRFLLQICLSCGPWLSGKAAQLWVYSMSSSSRTGHFLSVRNQQRTNLGSKWVDFSFQILIVPGKFHKTLTTFPEWSELIAEFNILPFSRINPYLFHEI